MAQPINTKKLLKVINRKNTSKDLLSISLRVLEDIFAKNDQLKKMDSRDIYTLKKIVMYFNTPESQFLKVNQPLSNIASILARDILKSHMMIPIVIKREREIRESDIDQSGKTSVYVQVPFRMEGLYKDRKIYLAEGENVVITGFKHGKQFNILKYLLPHNSPHNKIIANKKNVFLYLNDLLYIEGIESLKKILLYVRQVIKFYFSTTFNLVTKVDTRIPPKITYKNSGLNKFIENGIPELPDWSSLPEYKIINMLIKKYATITNTKINTNWSTSIEPFLYLNLFSTFDYYLEALDNGIDSEVLKHHFDFVQDNYNKELSEFQTNESILKNKTLALFYIRILKYKFPKKRYDEIMLKIVDEFKIKTFKTTGGLLGDMVYNIYDPQIIIDSVTKSEAKIITKEYENIVENWKMNFNNKCEHIGLLKKLHKGKTKEDSSKAFEEIKILMSEEKTDDWIHCKLCNMRLICPHAVAKMTQESIDSSHQAIKTAMYKFIDFDSENKKSKSLCFCKICSEKLIDERDEDIQVAKTSNISMDPEIRDKIYSALMNLSKNLRYTVSLDTKLLVNKGMNLIYPHIFTLENVALMAIIYSHAYILDIVNENENINYEHVAPGSKISVLANVLLKDMSRTYNQFIIHIPYATYDYLSDKFLEAYNNVKKKTTISSNVIDEVETVLREIILSPQYQYVTSTLKKIGKTSLNKKNNVKDTVLEFNKVLGMSYEDIMKQSKEIKKDKAFGVLFNGNAVKIDSNQVLEFFKKEPEVNLLRNIFELGDLTKAESKFLSKNGTIKEMTIGKIINGYRLFKMYSVDRTSYENVDIYNKELKKHNESSRFLKLSGSKPRELYRPYVRHMLTPKIVVPLSNIYDEDGNKHNWSLYKFGDKYLSKGEIHKTRLKMDIPDVFTDIRCSVCGIEKSKIDKLDNKKILTSLTENASAKAMITYFSDICPLDLELHKWVGDSCEKCGILANFKDNSGKRSFYNKYKQVFIRESPQKSELPEKKMVKIQAPTPEYANKWKHNVTEINNMAHTMNLNINLVNSIGRMENRYIEDIINGVSSPGYPSEKDSRSIYSVDSEIRNMKIELSKITNKKSHIVSDNDFSETYKNYNVHFSEIKQYRSAKDIYLYCLQTLCEIVNKVYEIDKDVARYLIDMVMKNQRSFVKPGKFKFSVFYSESADINDVGHDDTLKDVDMGESKDLIDDYIKNGQ